MAITAPQQDANSARGGTGRLRPTSPRAPAQLRGPRRAVAFVAGLPEALVEPTLPFFIERHGAARGPGIDAVEVSGDAVRLAEWLGPASLPVSVAAGEPAVLAVTVGGRTLT